MKKFRNRSSCWLTPDLIESEAFLSLSGKAAMLCLIRFHQKAFKKNLKHKKRNAYVVTNNGQIVFTFAEAKELGIKSSQTLWKSIQELVDKGFIDIAEVGNWYLKQSNKYAISNRWKHYGTSAFKKPKNKFSI